MYLLDNKVNDWKVKVLPNNDESYLIFERCINSSNSMLRTEERQKLLRVSEVSSKPIVDNLFQRDKNVLLFHGTSESAIQSVMANGIENSEKGRHGSGVYLTESPFSAAYWSFIKKKEKQQHLIAFEVLNTRKIQKYFYSWIKNKPFFSRNKVTSFNQYFAEPFLSVAMNGNFQYETDRNCNILKNKNPLGSKYITYVAPSTILIPRYILATGVEKNGVCVEDHDQIYGFLKNE